LNVTDQRLDETSAVEHAFRDHSPDFVGLPGKALALSLKIEFQLDQIDRGLFGL
jgi:hypothetical protein